MATKTRNARKAFMDYAVYVPVGAGKVLVDTARDVTGRATRVVVQGRDNVGRTYKDLADRGEKLIRGIRTSAYTKRAVDQVKAANRQVQSAARSVRKAAGTTAEATTRAAKRTVEPPKPGPKKSG